MNKPDRNPDFVCDNGSRSGIHEFYMYPDMIWCHKISPYSSNLIELIEEDGLLKCFMMETPHEMWDEVQIKYKAYKKKLDLQIDGILLDD